MNSYVILTDSGSDLSPALMAEWGVKYESLTLRFEGSDKEYTNADITAAEFYQRMREGEAAKTAAINAEDFKALFEPELEKGNDVLYLGFSSGLSTTYNSARLAAEELTEKYPERKVIAVDTLCASAGEGLIVYLAVQKQKAGASIEEAAQYIEEIKLKICHWFTVDDLKYLKRGGRVSPAVAFVGGLLDIKPVMHVDNDGHLVLVSKSRGRKAALAALAKKYTELAEDPANGTIYISNGDCMEDAKTLGELIKKEHGNGVDLITDIGPVIGAHSGPGTIAIFFVGKER